MSVEQARAFIEKMKTDDAFREKIMAIEKPGDRLIAIRKEGFHCTAEELSMPLGEEGFGACNNFSVWVSWLWLHEENQKEGGTVK